MITTKRQIRTNDDRYITSVDDVRANTAIGDIRSARDANDLYGRNDFADIRLTEEPVRETHEAYDFAAKTPVETRETVEEKPLYSTRETLRTELPPRPVKEKMPRDAEDVMPSLKTLSTAEQMADVKPTEKTVDAARKAESVAPRTNLTPKMKVALIISLAIALVLAIAVIATGVSLSHASAESARIAQEIAAKQTVIAEQQATLAVITSDSTLRDEALLHGMVPAGDSEYTASRAEKSDYPEAAPHTNGFDKFCDWLGGIIN